MQSQNERILAHLRVKPITALEALKYARCFRLSARIHDLRNQGHIIKQRMIDVKNDYGEEKRVAQYTLVKEA